MDGAQIKTHNDSTLSIKAPKIIEDSGFRRASIAIIIRRIGAVDELLLIQRARSEKDPWSGQIACPGGGFEQKDEDLLATSIRETREETSLELTRDFCIGRLDDQQGRNNNAALSLAISAYVFRLPENVRVDQCITPNYEVEDTLWMPFGWLFESRRQIGYATPFRNTPYDGIDLTPDASLSSGRSGTVSYEQSPVLWGLTYRFLNQLVSRHLSAG
ncbi:MAG: CoA pyrophosphatase [Pseudomonadota bacterium]